MQTYTVLIDGLCKGGRLNDAWEIFQYLLAKGFQVDAQTYTVMVHGFCTEGLLDEAIALLDKMEENGLVPDFVTFNVVLRRFLLEKNENARAEKLLHEMIARGLLKK